MEKTSQLPLNHTSLMEILIMKKTVCLLSLSGLILATPVAFSADLVQFQSNTPAKASEVNQNFAILQTQINDLHDQLNCKPKIEYKQQFDNAGGLPINLTEVPVEVWTLGMSHSITVDCPGSIHAVLTGAIHNYGLSTSMEVQIGIAIDTNPFGPANQPSAVRFGPSISFLQGSTGIQLPTPQFLFTSSTTYGTQYVQHVEQAGIYTFFPIALKKAGEQVIVGQQNFSLTFIPD